jgi:hypothetical protein
MSSSRRHSSLLRHGALVGAALWLTACGSSNPSSPSPPSAGSSAPTLSSPADDAVVQAHPSLVVNNVAGGQAGVRTYDFQVADSQAALTGPENGLFASQTGVAEGPSGRTSYDVVRDLQAGTRYYWRARATQSGAAGPWSSAFRFRTASAVNTPPVIQSISAAGRAEPNTDVDVSAVVQDLETSPANLTYEWSATAGSFSGTGAHILWRAPGVSGPTAFDLTLTVIEKYTVALDGGGEEARENRVTGKTTVHVNDSPAEVSNLALTFLDDFIHSDRSPEFCVRNFSDSCAGKQAELSDVRANRSMFLNDPSQSSIGFATPTFYDTTGRSRVVPPAQASFAEVLDPCRLAATNLATGVFGIAIGTCQLTAVYENFQWRLCESHFQPRAGASAFSKSFRF